MSRRPLDAVIRHIYRRAGITLPDTSDHDLLTAFVTGHDEVAFAAIVQRHGPLVWGLCRRLLVDRQDVEDAFQAAFLALVRQAASIRQRDRLGPWLYGVTLRIARKLRTGTARRQAQPPQPQPDGELDPVEAAGQREVRRLVTEELAALPAKYRDPLILCHLQGFSHIEAAAELGWPSGSLSRRMAKGSELLRDRLTRRGVTLTVAALLTETAADAAPHELAMHTIRLAGLVASAALGTEVLPVLALADAALRPMVVGLRSAVAAGLLLTALGVGGALSMGQPATQNPPPVAQKAAAATPATPPRLDAEGMPLPPGAVARLGSVLLRGSGGTMLSIAFSRDGKLLASGDNGHTVRLWDPATGREVRRISAPTTTPGHRGWIYAVAFTGDARILATACDSRDPTIRLWDVATGKQLHCLAGHQGDVRAVAFAPDDKTLASAGADGMIRLWDPATGAELRRLDGGKEVVRALAFAPDGRTLASAGEDSSVRLWDFAAGREARRLEGHRGTVAALAYAADGKALASAGQDGTVRLWAAATGEAIRAIDTNPAPPAQPGLGAGGGRRGVVCLAFAPDGRRLAGGGSDGNVRIWDANTGQVTLSISTNAGGVMGVAFAPDGKALASTGYGSRIQLWDPATGAELLTPAGHGAAVSAVAIAPDGKTLASWGADQTIRVWDLMSGRELRRAAPVPGVVRTLTYTPDGRTLVSSGSDGTIRLWDQAAGTQLRQFDGNARQVRRATVAPDGRLLAAGEAGGQVAVWDMASGKELNRWAGHRGPVQSLAFAPDSRTLVSGGSEGILLWDPATGRELARIPVDGLAVASVALSPDGRVVAVGGEVRLDPAAGGTIGGTSGMIRILEVSTGRERCRFSRLAGGAPPVVAFSPDGRILAAGEGRWVRLYDLGAGKQVYMSPDQQSHSNHIQALAFTPDGAHLASVGADNILVWKMADVFLHSQPPGKPLAARELETHWTTLADADAAKAYQAACALVESAGLAPAFLRERLHSVTAPDAERLARLITDLNDGAFAVRQKAIADLQALGERAGPALRQALARQPALEARQRLEQLLARFDGPVVTDPETLRGLRAVELLERLATPAVRPLLAELAQGMDSSRLTRAAQAALDRLARSVK